MSTNEKLPRVTSKIFASNAAEGDIGQFGSALTGTKVSTGDIEVIQALPAYEEGWRDAVVSGRNYPTLQEMNGLQKTFSQQIAYILQNGMPEWDAGTTYFTDQFCRVGSTFYVSLQDNNLGNNPTTTTGFWQVWTPFAGEFANIDLSNLSTTGQAVLDSKLNENQITNCILSAPNGVPSYSGNTITVYGSTQFLFSNGRNSNNTLQNTTFTAASNITGTMSGSTAGTFVVFVTSESSLIFANNINYFMTSTEPTALNDTTSQGVWYNPDLNTLSQCAATSSAPSWSTFEGARCATLTYDGSAITAINPIYPLHINDPSKFDGQWVSKEQTVTSVTSGTVEVDLSEYLPEDEYNYEIMMTYFAFNPYPNVQVSTFITSSVITTAGIYSYTSQGERASGQYTIAVGVDRKINVLIVGGSYPVNQHGIYAIAYRRLGTNE